MKKYILYGDGINDDTNAIQELIDSGVCEVGLPAPKKFYLISRPLVIPSCFKLKLPRFAEIRLADNSNCFMIKNKTVDKYEKRLRDVFPNQKHRDMFEFVNKFSIDKEDECHDFEIEGGIWNFNNLNQRSNPIQTGDFSENYLGHVMFFYNARSFSLRNITIKNPANYAIMIDTASYFTIENITFDYNFGNPYAVNMDGIHLNGNCHYGVIKNLQGACYDDFVALNAHEGSGGDITNIEIDGLFAENCHSAVRMLTVNHKIRNVTISNVYGTYYQYCIGFTKHYPGNTTGCFDAISLSNIHASKSVRLPVQEVHMKNDTSYQFPFIWFQGETKSKNISITDLHRREYENPVDTIYVATNAEIENLSLQNVSEENYVGKPFSTILNKGIIKNFRSNCIKVEDINNVNNGKVI